MITYRYELPSKEQIELLYQDAGWHAYTKDIDKLMRAISNSLQTIAAWEEEKLVGLIRAVGDGESILYLQDLLVLKNYWRQGIGSTLLEKMLSEYPDVRHKVLLTDATEPQLRAFYESLGFSSCDKGQLVAFARIDN